jgi:hypothetical protein
MPLEIKIDIPLSWDSDKNIFIKPTSVTLRLEHSLVSLSKWESVYKKPFLKEGKVSPEEMKYYIKCMTLDQNVKPYVYNYLSEDNIKSIQEYLQDSHTATTFHDYASGNRPSSNGVVNTSEVIYAAMFNYRVDKSCEKWNINRLLTLLRVLKIMNSDGKDLKMSKSEILAQNKALNAARRAKMNSKG